MVKFSSNLKEIKMAEMGDGNWDDLLPGLAQSKNQFRDFRAFCVVVGLHYQKTSKLLFEKQNKKRKQLEKQRGPPLKPEDSH